jgi:DNA-binding PadR family transcriptional regulator
MTTNEIDTLPVVQTRVLAALRGSPTPMTVLDVRRALSLQYGERLARSTISGALHRLLARGLVAYHDDGPRSNARHWLALPEAS